jgi:hypothetical protein
MHTQHRLFFDASNNDAIVAAGTYLPESKVTFHLTLITIKLLDFVHRPDFYKQKCFLFVEIRTMDKVQKLNSNECYTPSSEPFRMYFT